jgi:hypothetical protein
LVPVVASNLVPLVVSTALTLRPATATFPAVDTMPAIVPPTGSFGSLLITGSG